MTISWKKHQALIKWALSILLALGGWFGRAAWEAGKEYQHFNDRIEQHDRSLQKNDQDHKDIKGDVKDEVSSLRKDMNNGFKEVTRELAAVGQKVDDLREARQADTRHMDKYGLALGGTDAKAQ